MVESPQLWTVLRLMVVLGIAIYRQRPGRHRDGWDSIQTMPPCPNVPTYVPFRRPPKTHCCTGSVKTTSIIFVSYGYRRSIYVVIKWKWRRGLEKGHNRTCLCLLCRVRANILAVVLVFNYVREGDWMVMRIEIRSAEGGDDSKLLIRDMASIYAKACKRRCL
jgi:hypothetical protein